MSDENEWKRQRIGGNILSSENDLTNLLKVEEQTLLMVFLTYNLDANTPWRSFISQEKFKFDHKKMHALKEVSVDLLITGGVKSHQLSHVYKVFTTDYFWGHKKIISPEDGNSMSWCSLQTIAFHSRGFMVSPSTPGKYLSTCQVIT